MSSVEAMPVDDGESVHDDARPHARPGGLLAWSPQQPAPWSPTRRHAPWSPPSTTQGYRQSRGPAPSRLLPRRAPLSISALSTLSTPKFRPHVLSCAIHVFDKMPKRGNNASQYSRQMKTDVAVGRLAYKQCGWWKQDTLDTNSNCYTMDHGKYNKLLIPCSAALLFICL